MAIFLGRQPTHVNDEAEMLALENVMPGDIAIRLDENPPHGYMLMRGASFVLGNWERLGGGDTAGLATSDDLAAEATTRAASDTTLQTNISSEASARIAADTTLQNNINSEAASRTAADTTLTNNLTIEASGRSAADTTLQANITAEATSRSLSDTTLQANIDGEATTRASAVTTLTNNLTTEASGRASADTTLQANIDGEAASRTAGDTTLQTNLNSEATTRASADTTLQTNITNETTRATTVENGITTSVSTLDAATVKSVNSVTPASGSGGAIQVPGVYRGVYTPGMVLYVNDVVNDSGFDRRVTIAHTAGASINLNNFASPASISADTLLGIASWTGANVETDASHGFFPVKSRLRNDNRTKITRFRARTVTDLVTTSGSPNVSSATAVFNSTEAATGGGSAVIAVGVPLGAKILTFVDAQNVVLTSNATASASGVTATISPDVVTWNLPAQISSDADPIDPQGVIKMRGSGFTANTITSKVFSPTIDISNSIIRMGVRLVDAGGGSARHGMKSCNIEVSSNNFADSNYKFVNVNIRDEFRIGNLDIWDVVGCGPADWTVSGTGASGNLSAINAVRIRFDRDSGPDIFLSPAYIDYEPITATKAKCVIWLDDGFTLHWTDIAPLLHSYGFKATMAPNILEPTAMSPLQLRYLQDHYGWQIAQHARTSAEHTNISGDAFRRNLLASRHAINSFGLSGGDDFAWWGGLIRDFPNTKEARKMFRTARLAIARIGETLPPINPEATMAQQFLEGMSWTTDLQPWAQKAINQNGVAQFVFHATTNTLAVMTDMCAWLDANRNLIDVVTWEEAIRPYIDYAPLASSGTGGVPTSRLITAGTGLSGGGDLSADRTLSVAFGTSGTTAAVGNDSRLSDTRTPTDGTVTDAKIGPTGLTNSSISASAGIAKTKLASLAIVDADVSAISESKVTSLVSDLAAKAPASRNITAGTGLSGGGDLTADRTLTVSYGSSSSTAAQGNDARIVGAAQVANNLSDLASAATARTNLTLGNVDNTSDATKNSATATLTNKRITKRIATLTDAATVTPDIDSYDGGKLLTVSQTTTFANPTGTPTAFQQYMLRIKSTSAQTLAFGTQYRTGTDMALPTTTTGSSKTDYFGFQWNSDDSKWDLVAVARGF